MHRCFVYTDDVKFFFFYEINPATRVNSKCIPPWMSCRRGFVTLVDDHDTYACTFPSGKRRVVTDLDRFYFVR